MRSFGTEDRHVDGPPIPARDEVYGLIIFKGSDISDLHVAEAPVVSNIVPGDSNDI